MAGKNTAVPGQIDEGSLYTLDEIKRRLGLGDWALRTARRRGLVVRRIGTRGYVLGKDMIEFIRQSAE